MGSAFAVWALPARAATVKISDSLSINLGEIAPWVAIFLTLVIWWDARKARHSAAAAAVSAASADTKIGVVSKQVDGLLLDRDKANLDEGEAKGKRAGEAMAVVLAEGQRQGRETEREAASGASSGGVAATGQGPLPVADDRAAIAGERGAAATERSADAAVRGADKK